MTQITARAATESGSAPKIAGAIPLIDVAGISPAMPRAAGRPLRNFVGIRELLASTTGGPRRTAIR